MSIDEKQISFRLRRKLQLTIFFLTESPKKKRKQDDSSGVPNKKARKVIGISPPMF